MSAAGLQTIGGTGSIGLGTMERVLRVVPGTFSLVNQDACHVALLPEFSAM